MRCPKCQSQMEKVPTKEGVADRCTQCKGMWFEMLEHEDLKDYASVIDVGSDELGKRYNQVDDIKCPICPNSKMLKMVDALQPHIWFESCPTCYGRFFDAGEFRDVSERTIGDFIKKLSAKARA